MPPVKKPVTFLGWLEDLIKLPKEIATNTYAVVKAPYNDTFYLLQVRVSAAESKITDQEFITAFTEGPEAVSDIKGVNTVVSLKELFTNPKKTVQILGSKTLNDIFNLDEISEDRRAELISRLTRGQVTDGNALAVNSKYHDWGEFLDVPTNQIVGTINDSGALPLNEFPYEKEDDPAHPGKKRYRIDPANGHPLSNIKLLVDTTNGTDPQQRGDWEDRKTEEEGEARYDQYKTYAALAGAITKMSSDFEVTTGRISARDSANREYMRSVMRESGIDLESVLDRTLPTLTPSTAEGSLHTLLKHHAIEDILANPVQIEAALGLVNPFTTYSPQQQELMRSFLKQEDLNIRSAIPLDKLQTAGMSTIFDGTDYAVSGSEGKFRKSVMKGDLEHLKSQYALESYLKADVYNVHARSMIVENLQAKGKSADEISRALNRISHARRATELTNNLFFAGTFKEIMEAVEQGSFMKTALVSTRLLGLLPFANKNMRSANQLPQFLLPNNNPVIKKAQEFMQNKVPASIGIAFSSNELNPLGRVINASGIFDNVVVVDWKQREIAPTGAILKRTSTFKGIKAAEAAGTFDKDYGIYNVLNTMNQHQLWDGLPLGYTSQSVMENFSQLDSFYNELESVANFINTSGSTAGANPQYVDILRKFGIIETSSTGTFSVNMEIFNVKATFDASGRKLLEKLSSPTLMGDKRLFEMDRWNFLQVQFKNGHAAQLTKRYVGLLNKYNQYANAARNYIYKNIVFGDALLKLPGLGGLARRGQKFLGNLGMSDEVGLIKAFARWRIIRHISKFGRTLQRSNIASPRGLQAARLFGGKMFGPLLAKSITYLAKSAAGKVILKSIGYLLSGIAGTLTGGVSWIVAAFGDTIWAFGKNMLMFKPKEAIKAASGTIKRKIDAIKKVAVYPIACTCGCMLAPLLGMMFIIFFMITSLTASFGELTGTGGGQTQSEYIRVSKSAVYNSIDKKVAYTITLTNISETDPITIGAFDDNLSFTPPCGADGNSVTQNLPTPIGSYTGQTVTKDTPLVIRFDVDANNHGTYFNTIKVTAAEEPDTTKYAVDTVSTDVEERGCIKCPEGWPFGSFAYTLYVTQGPYATSATEKTSHGSSEAVDFATGRGLYNPANPQMIVASHSGTAYTHPTICADSDHSENCGYGNYVVVVSPGGYSTLYAHLMGFNVSNGAQVQKGTEIGRMGNIGNSSGTHLHYEFRSPYQGYECLPGEPLRLEQVQGEMYVPQTIPYGCYSYTECNMSLP